MPVSIAAMTASHGWASSAAFAALYGMAGGINGTDGTPLELDTSILDILGAPIYARMPVALTEETDGMLSMANAVTFGVPAGSTVNWISLLDVNGNQLTLDPVSDSVLSNVPQPCLFDDSTTGWIKRPVAQSAGSFVVFWSGTNPGVSTLFSIGGYTTLPSNLWALGAYAVWPVREQAANQFKINDAVGMSDAARFDADVFLPSNFGWGYWQRMDPITYAVDGTFILNAVHVRTVG